MTIPLQLLNGRELGYYTPKVYRPCHRTLVHQVHCSRKPRQDALTTSHTSQSALQAANAGPAQLSPAKAARELRKLTSALPKRDITLKLNTARGRRVKDLIKVIQGNDSIEKPCPLALGQKGVTDALWGMAMLGERVLFMEETASILRVVDFTTSHGRKGFSKDQLVDIIWALAKASHWTPKLEAATARLSSMGGLPSLQPFQIVNLLWALATLNYPPPALFTATPQLNGKAFNPTQLSIICWSLCVLQQYTTPLFRSFWEELADCWAHGRFNLTPQWCSQVYQIVRTQELEGGANRTSWPVGQQEMAAKAEQLWTARCKAERKSFAPSMCHNELMRKLIGMGVAHTYEDISTGLLLDVAILELQIAIEIDGPHHFARNAVRPLGATALKRRHLKAMGWAVFSVTTEDWNNAARQRERLQELRELMVERRQVLGRL